VHQTYEHLEIFVIRDGGEEVDDIVQSFRDPRVVFIDRKDNRGKPFSLNEALRRAQGKYVAYLDDDDIYYPHHVETLVGALETGTDCPVAYSDLYKVWCDVSPEGGRQALSKHVEISRDFDRFLMLYFNHVLHVSLMHRRDLLDKTGPYNERLNILIDWDITRRLAFFCDFQHVPTVTGEFYSPVGESDRISFQRRKDPQEYLRNILAIRTARPSKPWPKIDDLSIILVADHLNEQIADTLLRIWRHTFYPYKVYIPLPSGDLTRLNVQMPNVELVPVNPLSTAAERIDAAMRSAEGQYVAIVPADVKIEEMWVENALYALIHDTAREGFLLEGGSLSSWPAVLRRADLERARRAHPQMSFEASLAASGIALREPKDEELPFQFDELLRQAKLAEAEGNWRMAARLYQHMGERFGNGVWMKSMAALACFEAGDHAGADRLSREVNCERPTVDTLLLEAKVCRERQDFAAAIRLLTQAEQWLGPQAGAIAYGKRNLCST
jgi:glycosyltransferase involved in cell wall biosynthesis